MPSTPSQKPRGDTRGFSSFMPQSSTPDPLRLLAQALLAAAEEELARREKDAAKERRGSRPPKDREEETS